MDEKMIKRICRLLQAKFGLALPPDTDADKFGRDLLGALHGHPGYLGDQGSYDAEDFDDEDDGEDDDDQSGPDFDDREDADTGGQLSHARRRGGVPRISPARAKQVVEELRQNGVLAR